MVYLVDFENVTSAGISGIQRLTKEDKVYIFYTVNASNMSFAAHMNLLSSPAEIIYYNVASGGKNALDFQLSSFLGYLISKGEEKSFCIISNDKGYEYVRTFWEKNGLVSGISINGAPSINRALIPAERPFAAKIQQKTNNQPKIDSAEQTVTAEQIEAASPAEKAEPAKIPEKDIVQETAPIPVDDPVEVTENKPKKRGRPKGKKNSSQSVSAVDSGGNANSVQPVSENQAGKKKNASQPVPANEGKGKKNASQNVPANEGKGKKNASQPVPANEGKGKKKASQPVPANEPKASAAKGKKSAPNSNINSAIDYVKPLLAKAGVTDLAKIAAVAELLRKTDGKQQFYRSMLTIFGMEKGVVVYKAIRPEYTNLTKLVKQ